MMNFLSIGPGTQRTAWSDSKYKNSRLKLRSESLKETFVENRRRFLNDPGDFQPKCQLRTPAFIEKGDSDEAGSHIGN